MSWILCKRKRTDKSGSSTAAEPIERLSEWKAVILIVLLAVGLWAAIWGVFLLTKWLLGLTP